jgi:4a-hydroxytetrahydrobiopterin dehydratase
MAHTLLEPEDLREKLKSIPLWSLNEKGQLCRNFEAKSHKAASNFAKAVSEVSEQYGHYPEIHVTTFRSVEIILYSHKPNGITELDITMAKRFDEIPVEYAMSWISNHQEVLDNMRTLKMGTTSTTRHLPTDHVSIIPATHENDMATVRQESKKYSNHHIHHETEAVIPPPQSSHIHSTMRTDEGIILHPHDFTVHTGHEIQMGRSDASQYEINPVLAPSGIMYETETQNELRQALSADGKTHYEQHGHDMKFKIPDMLISTPTASTETWNHMLHALTILSDAGYDKTESEYYKPMIQQGLIYPDVEEGLFYFYKHLLHRLTPEWRKSEPPGVVGAALEFVEGYEAVKGIIF